MKKLRVAQYSLTGCEGCAIAIINALARIPKLLDHLEIVTSRIIGYVEPKEADIAFVDGAVITEHDLETLKEIRRKTRILVAMGSCASFGGIPAMRDDIGFKEAVRIVYGSMPNIPHTGRVEPLDYVVKVDYVLPGCPPPDWELEIFLRNMLLEKKFVLPDKPVCFECRSNGVPCLLDQGKVCLGPITTAGCDAICPLYNVPCLGCRGPIEELRLDKYLEALEEHGISVDELLEELKVFMNKTKPRIILEGGGK